MQTLKEVLGRAEERRNLQSMWICVVTVVLLVGVLFALVQMKHLVGGVSEGTTERRTVIEAAREP